MQSLTFPEIKSMGNELTKRNIGNDLKLLTVATSRHKYANVCTAKIYHLFKLLCLTVPLTCNSLQETTFEFLFPLLFFIYSLFFSSQIKQFENV